MSNFVDAPASDIGPSAWRRVHWPDGQLVAMTIGIAFEAFERQSQFHTERIKPGLVDRFSLSYADYGARVGVWRLLELLDRRGVKGTFSLSGLAAERHRDAIQAMVAGGHDLVAHGWVNDLVIANLEDDGESVERDVIRRTIDAITESAGGVRPRGWSSPGNMGSSSTMRLLVEEGIMWCGDDASDDLPFVETVADRPLVILPKANLAANDLHHWIFPNSAPSVFFDNFADHFDAIYDEALRGRPQWMDIVLHCHMAGRPTFIPTLTRVLDAVAARPGVWWTTKGDLAEWALEQDFRRDG